MMSFPVRSAAAGFSAVAFVAVPAVAAIAQPSQDSLKASYLVLIDDNCPNQRVALAFPRDEHTRSRAPSSRKPAAPMRPPPGNSRPTPRSSERRAPAAKRSARRRRTAPTPPISCRPRSSSPSSRWRLQETAQLRFADDYCKKLVVDWKAQKRAYGQARHGSQRAPCQRHRQEDERRHPVPAPATSPRVLSGALRQVVFGWIAEDEGIDGGLSAGTAATTPQHRNRALPLLPACGILPAEEKTKSPREDAAMRRWALRFCAAFAVRTIFGGTRAGLSEPNRCASSPPQAPAASATIFIRVLGDELQKKWGSAAGGRQPARRPAFKHRRTGLRGRSTGRLHHLHPSVRRPSVQPLSCSRICPTICSRTLSRSRCCSS